MSKKIFSFLVLVILVGFSYSLYAQILTGTIKGTVKDEGGEALPGVSVELHSPALIGGRKSTLTSDRGVFYFSNLPPGVYELAFSLSGFQTLKREKIQVRVDSTVTQDVVLSTEVIQESVTVVATNPVVDVTKSGISTNWQTEMMESLPLLRYTFFDVVNSTPGVWSHGGNTDDSRSVAFGSGSDSNTYLFDGVDTTSPDYGAGWSWLNPDVVEEIQIIGIGGKAEYGNFMGATVNIITKSGGNQFRGEVGGYLQTSGLTGDNSGKFLKDLLDNEYITEDQQYPYHREKFYDASFQLGGPIVKDRIWFYFAGWLHNDASSSAGVNPSGYTSCN